MRFNETYYLVRNGKKTATTRKIESFEYYGKKVGSICYAQHDNEPDIRIRISSVCRKKLESIANFNYEQEGFQSPQAFIDCWKKIYGSYDPGEEGCFIEFVLVDFFCPDCRQRMKKEITTHGTKYLCETKDCSVIEVTNDFRIKRASMK